MEIIDKTTKGPTKVPFNIRTTEDPKALGRISGKGAENRPLGQAGKQWPTGEGVEYPQPGDEQDGGLYVISVAARLLAMHPQTLRKYERAGLISPSRTIGMLRLYSEEDIVRLRLIKHMVEVLGLNLAGVNLALSLVDGLLAMNQRLQSMGMQDLRGFLDEHLAEVLDLLHNKD